MLKIRMRWGQFRISNGLRDFLERHKEIKVKSVSEPFRNKGQKIFSRLCRDRE